ncbi:MAG TPA: EamA family transporter [Gaiellaceae bacterium]|nr:EamA family transporter [Gaiellaceae bacterium]
MDDDNDINAGNHARGLTASGVSPTARLRAVLALVAAALIWGSSFVVTKLLLKEAEPFFIAAARFAIALGVLWPLLVWRDRTLAPIRSRPHARIMLARAARSCLRTSPPLLTS